LSLPWAIEEATPPERQGYKKSVTLVPDGLAFNRSGRAIWTRLQLAQEFSPASRWASIGARLQERPCPIVLRMHLLRCRHPWHPPWPHRGQLALRVEW